MITHQNIQKMENI